MKTNTTLLCNLSANMAYHDTHVRKLQHSETPYGVSVTRIFRIVLFEMPYLLDTEDRDNAWLRYEDLQYTVEVVMDFESRLSGIFTKQVNRLQVLDFGVLTKEMDQIVIDRLRMDYTRDDGQVVFTSHAWRRLFEIRSPQIRELMLGFFSTCRFTDVELGLDVAVLSYTAIRDPLRRLCHHLIAFSISGRGQALEKLTHAATFGAQAAALAPAPRTLPQRMVRLEEDVHCSVYTAYSLNEYSAIFGDDQYFGFYTGPSRQKDKCGGVLILGNNTWKGPTWIFDLDYLTDSMNYQHVRSENQANKHAGPQEANQNPVKRSIAKDVGDAPNKYPDLKTNGKPVDKEDQVFLDELERHKRQEKDANDAAEALRKEFSQETKNLLIQAGAAKASSTNIVNTVSTPVSTASPYDGLSLSDPTNPEQDDSEIPALEDIYQNPTDGIFTNSSYNDEGAVADFTNLESVVNVSPIPTSRIHSIHPSTLILRDPQLAVQTRSKVTKSSRAHAFVSYIQKQRRNNHKDFQHCLFACFLSQNEPKKISEALEDKSWVDAMQEELLQFKIQKVYRNKKDERGVVVRNKARLVAQGHRQEEEIDYDEVFAPVARIEAIRIFLAFASYMGFIVYQMDVKSAFLYGKIDEESVLVLATQIVTMLRQILTGNPQRKVVNFFSQETDFLAIAKSRTIVATSTTEAEYVAAANCCGQVLWIQNQMLDYGFNFMNTKIYIDNESTICIVKNPVYHSKTKHIAIRHHFIKDAYEKKLIHVLKIHTDDNVADLLTKAFDVSRFQFLVVTIGMINL
ncbi:putative ribonuclease H-like domain-containing protein [Tanacetum coccineum]